MDIQRCQNHRPVRLFDEVLQIRETLDSRYDDLKSGKVKAIDGEEFFESLRRREDDLLTKRSPK